MLSFIIPAYNEEKNISRTIEKINEYVPNNFQYEVIVVDHGSTDRTINLAKEKGSRVFNKHNGTVASLRNFGVEKSYGDIIVFIDADVLLTPEWQQNIVDIVIKIKHGARFITGSWVSIPDNATRIEKYWFKPLQNLQNTHINSGHMILSRSLFDELNGFDAKLVTGEDYDISMRAKKLNIQIIDNHNLKVIHMGYPSGLREFMFREYWHGKGDSVSVKAMAKSKVALIALTFIVLHIALLYSLFTSLSLYVFYGCIFGIFLICFASSFMKFRRESMIVICVNCFLYYFYFVSRASSLLTGFFKYRIKKRQR